MDIREVSISDPDSKHLINLLDRELGQEYAPENMHSVDFEPFKTAGGVFVIAYDDNDPIGCGALRPLSETEVEIKRMFVVPERRRMGVSKMVLRYLEEKARSLQFKTIKLETGDAQEAAIKFYSSFGFSRIEPFGVYRLSSRSVCFEKQL